MATFADRLRITIEIAIGDAEVTIPAGNVKRLELALESWGFSGSAEMWIVAQGRDSPDALFASFTGAARASITLTVKRALDTAGEVAVPMVLHGVVTARRVTERIAESVQGAPVLQRRYTVSFRDRLAAAWSLHHPSKVYVGKTFKNVIDDHALVGCTLSHDWSAADVAHPVLAVHLPTGAGPSSFLDFVHWLLRSRNAALHYGAAADAWSIRDSPPAASGDPESIDRAVVAAVDTSFPATRRATVHVLNTFTDAATRNAEIPNLEGVSGLRRDLVIRSPIESELTARVAREVEAAADHGPITRLGFRQFPAVPLIPPMRAVLGQGFGPALRQSGATLRVISTHVVAVAERQGSGEDTDDETNRYDFSYEVQLVADADKARSHPPIVPPVFPLLVEGKVVSGVGEAIDETYESETDAATSADRYRVNLQLWDDTTIVAPFDAGFLSGHFYFPLTKGARVLVSFDLDEARIVSVLDWRSGGRLPLDSQGDHLLFGKSATSQTSFRHVYEDGKPALSIVRTSSGDVQTIEISDGRFYMETKDAGG